MDILEASHTLLPDVGDGKDEPSWASGGDDTPSLGEWGDFKSDSFSLGEKEEKAMPHFYDLTSPPSLAHGFIAEAGVQTGDAQPVRRLVTQDELRSDSYVSQRKVKSTAAGSSSPPRERLDAAVNTEEDVSTPSDRESSHSWALLGVFGHGQSLHRVESPEKAPNGSPGSEGEVEKEEVKEHRSLSDLFGDYGDDDENEEAGVYHAKGEDSLSSEDPGEESKEGKSGTLSSASLYDFRVKEFPWSSIRDEAPSPTACRCTAEGCSKSLGADDVHYYVPN